MPDINLTPSFSDLEAIKQRRKMAELLMQQAQQPIEMPQVAGARISPIQGLAKLLQGYIGGKNLEKANAEEKQYQSDYLSDLGFLMRNAGKSTPATEAIPEQIENITTPNIANQNLQAVSERQSYMRDPNAAINPFEKQMGADERAKIAKSPLQTVEERVTPAVPAMAGSPLLSADLLSGNNANGYIKTGAGKMALVQYLMQQQAQQQAAAQRAQEAKLAVHSVAPGAALVQDNKPVYTNPKEVLPKWEKSSIYENGQEVTGWVNTNAPDIPGSFVKGATKPEMTASQQLDAELKLFQAKVEADKAQDVGRKPTVFERLPKGVPVGAKKVGKDKETGKDVYKLNNELFVGE